MKNRDFREIQVSSSLLVVIFLGVLALGVFIFLLGVSVGKTQAAAAAPTQIVTQQIPEPVKEAPVKPTPNEIQSDPGAAGPGAADPQAAGETAAPRTPARGAVADKTPSPKTPAPAAAKKTPSVTATGLYYVQVAAFTDKAQAQAAADRYKKQGYTAVVANPKPMDTKTWYRVRLGGYTTRDRAVDLLGKLNAAAGKTTDFRIVQD